MKLIIFSCLIGWCYGAYAEPYKRCSSVPSMDCQEVEVPKVEEKVEKKCEMINKNVCHTEEETKQREVCRTVTDEKCSTEYDTVVRRACRLDQEEKCYNTPQMDCNMVEKTKTETVIDNVCKVVYDTKCTTVVDNVCKTVNERQCAVVIEKQCEQVMNQKCTTVDDTVCKIVTDKKCEQVEKEQCSTATKKECHTEYKTKVETIPRRECKQVNQQVCGKIPHEECKDVTRKECVTNHKERECKAVSKQICDDSGKCVDVPAMECKDVPKEVCLDVVDRECNTVEIESCESVPSMECKDVNEQVETMVPNEVCVDVPETTCVNIPTMECKDVPREVCTGGVKETCVNVPSMSCKDVPRDDCKDVPVQSCNDVPREVCKEVAREECSKVPREVSKKVQEKVCGIVDHKTCRPVPKEVCTDVADKVPREVCVDVPRQLCEEEPFQVSKEVCVDVPEEKCWDEKFTVTTYTKEKQCKQVMVETCRTKREAIQPALRKIASLSPSTDSNAQVNWQSYSQQVLGSPLAVRSSPLDAKSPSAKAALSYLQGALLGADSCGQQAKVYLETILSGGSAAQANAEATAVYIRNYNAGERAAPGSPCEAADVAFRQAAAAGQDPVLAAALAFMKSYESDSPCFVSARDYVDSIVSGSTQTEANLKAAKAFAHQLQNLAARGKPTIDEACYASAQAFSPSSESPSSPLSAAMQAFITKALETGSGFDSACFGAAEKFFEGFESGKGNLVATLAVAREVMQSYKNSPTISSRSPCAAAAKAYAAATTDSSSPITAAMQAFINKALDAGNGYDPSCYAAAESFFESFESGKPELRSTFAAARNFLRVYKTSPASASRSPCAAAATAYAAATKNSPSPPTQKALLAFVEEAVFTEDDGLDPVCGASAEAYFNTYLTGAGEAASSEAAAVAYLEAVGANPGFDPESPCGRAAKAYIAAF